MRLFPGQADAAEADWDNMPWHQKAQHIIDHIADAFMTYYYLWMPAVATSMLGSLLIFSPEGSLPEIMNMFLAHGTPVIQPAMFGRKLPNFDGEQGDEGEDDGSGAMDE